MPRMISLQMGQINQWLTLYARLQSRRPPKRPRSRIREVLTHLCS